MIHRVIYTYKICNNGPEFPLDHQVSGVTFEFKSIEGAGSVRYVKNLRKETPELILSSGGAPISPRGTLEQILTELFKADALGEALIETQIALPTPLILPLYSKKKVPDYLVTLKSRPEIELRSSECEDPLVPFRYRLPGEDDWVEVDALGVKGMGFSGKLKNYLKKVEQK